MNPMERDPIAAALSAVFNPSNGVIDGIFYYFEKLDEMEKRHRYDDNLQKFMGQALRLFEQGELSKEQLIQIIQMLPETQKAKAVEIPQKVDLNQVLEKLLNQ